MDIYPKTRFDLVALSCYNGSMIICFGEILADIFVNGADTQISLGGAPLNVAVAAHRSGVEVCFVGRVGADLLGDMLIEKAKAYGVNLHIQKDKDRNTSIALVTLTDGERSFDFLRKNGADAYVSGDGVDVGEGDILHFGSLPLSTKDGRATCLALARKAHKAGALVSFDVNYREGIFDEAGISAIREMIDIADVVKYSGEDMAALYPDQGEDALSEAKARLSVLTLGSEGCMVYFEGAMGYVPSEPVVPVDSTGAGDAFWGAMLAEIAKRHWNSLDMVAIEDCAEIACKNGAEATQYVGALPPLL